MLAGLTRRAPSVHFSLGLLSDLRLWRGWPANDEAISTTGLRVGARQALYSQQRSLFRALLTLHRCLVVSTGALVGPNPAFTRITTWWRQWEMINEPRGSLNLGSKRSSIIPLLPVRIKHLSHCCIAFTAVVRMYMCVNPKWIWIGDLQFCELFCLTSWVLLEG